MPRWKRTLRQKLQRKKEKVLAIQRDEGLELKDKIDKLVDSAEY